MNFVNQNCVNPECETELEFSIDQIGTVQSCSNCGQKMRIRINQSPVKDDFDKRQKTILKETSQYSSYIKNQNQSSFRKKKKVKAGSGCMAMMAVILGCIVITIGLSIGSDVSWSSIGKIFSFAGIAGVAAFAYFGYFAVEEEDSHSDGQKSKRRH